MPLQPLFSEKTKITKSPKHGNESVFSNGRRDAEIIAFKVWGSEQKRKSSYYPKIYSEEVSAVFRTHDALGKELQSDDILSVGDYEYRIISVKPIKTAMSLFSMDYEIGVV